MHSRHHRKYHDDFINRRHVFSLLSSRKLYRSLVTVSTKNSGKTEMILLLGKRKRKKKPWEISFETPPKMSKHHAQCEILQILTQYSSTRWLPYNPQYKACHLHPVTLSKANQEGYNLSSIWTEERRARFVIILWSNMQTRIEY